MRTRSGRWILSLAAALLIPACGDGGSEPPADASTAAALEVPGGVQDPQPGEPGLESGQPPNVMIVSPATSTTVQAGATLSVQAIAVSPGALIVQADLYDGARRVATRSSAPFIFPLGGLTAGSHVLTVVALDIQGLTGVSAPVTIFVVSRS